MREPIEPRCRLGVRRYALRHSGGQGAHAPVEGVKRVVAELLGDGRWVRRRGCVRSGNGKLSRLIHGASAGWVEEIV